MFVLVARNCLFSVNLAYRTPISSHAFDDLSRVRPCLIIRHRTLSPYNNDDQYEPRNYALLPWLCGSNYFPIMPDRGRGETTRELRDGYQIFVVHSIS
jgi:hypothetical protein